MSEQRFPKEVHCSIIGQKLPPIVEWCLQQNKELCKIYDIPFVIHHPIRDLSYKSAAIQVDFHKCQLLSAYPGMVYVDWDTVLYSLPYLEDSDFPYCGFMPTLHKPDIFLCYSPTENSSKFFRLLVDEMNNAHRGRTIEGLTFTVLNRFTEKINVFPEEFYYHYNTGLSSPTVDMYDNLAMPLKEYYDQTVKRNAERMSKWPL